MIVTAFTLSALLLGAFMLGAWIGQRRDRTTIRRLEEQVAERETLAAFWHREWVVASKGWLDSLEDGCAFRRRATETLNEIAKDMRRDLVGTLNPQPTNRDPQ